MKWLKSTTQKTWTVNGKIIPACVTPHNDYLKVEDSEYAAMSKVPVVASLIKVGGILVLSEEPAELKNSLDNLQTSNAVLQARVTQLEEELKRDKMMSQAIDVEAIKAEAQEEIRAEAVKELQEKQDALDAKDAEIKKLKKQLAEAKKVSSEV